MMKKSHKKVPKTFTYTRHLIKFGSFGFKALSKGILKKEQIGSLERTLQKKVKSLTSTYKNIKIWCFLYPNKTVTKLSPESRMGKGKGTVYTESVFVKPGCIIYELQNVSLQQAWELFFFMQKQTNINLVLVQKTKLI